MRVCCEGATREWNLVGGSRQPIPYAFVVVVLKKVRPFSPTQAHGFSRPEKEKLGSEISIFNPIIEKMVEENGNGVVEAVPVLGYWRIRGLVQPVRFLLAYTGTEFEEKYYEIGPDLSRESWLKEKFNLGLDLPNLPYWIDGDIKLTQSRAILRHAAREKAPDLLGLTAEQQRRIDMLENHVFDFWTALINLCYRFTEEDKNSFLLTLPKQLELLSNFYKGKQWATGDNLTYVDFVVYEALYQHKVFEPDCLSDFPVLESVLERFEALPAIKDFMQSPRYLHRPLYTRLARHYI